MSVALPLDNTIKGPEEKAATRLKSMPENFAQITTPRPKVLASAPSTQRAGRWNMYWEGGRKRAGGSQAKIQKTVELIESFAQVGIANHDEPV
jgi:hypothetical protein